MLAVTLGCLLLGGLTSYAQGFLPGVARPLANSGGGWMIVTALLVWLLVRGGSPYAAVAGLLGFVALVLGYTLISYARGLAYNPLLFGVVAIVGGPFVGVAATWLHRTGQRCALGAGLLAGVLIGEGVYGPTTVAATTGHAYWVASIVLGLALLVALTAAGRLGRPGRAPTWTALGATVLVAAVFLGLWKVLGTL